MGHLAHTPQPAAAQAVGIQAAPILMHQRSSGIYGVGHCQVGRGQRSKRGPVGGVRTQHLGALGSTDPSGK
ncbi:hypothetical protein NDU88_002390 [Pleurodeles waltl]|uniref:Uncharacterized protein n=1 Tax=Pleurodeles waltl TaxID=8319 RepID=A0AAV7VDP1_PLEWA|nr:hypothetical protein NDU88_002390 [Pleurodeles waltl]